MPQELTPSHIIQEATALFVGKRGVIGVGLSNEHNNELTFFLEKHNIVQEKAIQAWARKRGIHSEFVLAGKFLGAHLA